MRLRFPIPKIIQKVCQYFGISPSQLLPNFYSILLSLEVLLRFFGFRLSMGLLIMFIQVSRPEKILYQSQPEHKFLGGLPFFHKWWPNRFFYVQASTNVPWVCDMSWVDNLIARFPPLIAPEPILPNFLTTMSVRCFRTTSLTQDDLLCHFGFFQKRIKIEVEICKIGILLLLILLVLYSCHSLLTPFLFVFEYDIMS